MKIPNLDIEVKSIIAFCVGLIAVSFVYANSLTISIANQKTNTAINTGNYYAISKKLTDDNIDLQNYINSFTSNGNELVSSYKDGNYITLIFKGGM